jgi:hypothetical protein
MQPEKSNRIPEQICWCKHECTGVEIKYTRSAFLAIKPDLVQQINIYGS